MIIFFIKLIFHNLEVFIFLKLFQIKTGSRIIEMRKIVVTRLNYISYNILKKYIQFQTRSVVNIINFRIFNHVILKLFQKKWKRNVFWQTEEFFESKIIEKIEKLFKLWKIFLFISSKQSKTMKTKITRVLM